jgi:carboxylesterase type B
VHAAELPSVWGLPGAALPAMHAAWVRFIGGAAPGAAGWPDWPRFDPAQRRTMILDAAPHVMADPRGAERQIWAGVL